MATVYTLAANQANSTVTLATIGPSVEPWTFNVPPGATLNLKAMFAFTSAATTTGLSLSALVAMPADANGSATGVYRALISVDAAVAATAVEDGDVVSVAANVSTSYTVTSAASTAGDMTAKYETMIRNRSSNKVATVTLQFASEVAASAVTLLAGSSVIGDIA